MISKDEVKMSGPHKKLISVADSVKIMLVKVSDKAWSVRAILPISNTMAWSDVPGTDDSAQEYYGPSMWKLSVAFLDANGNSLRFSVTPKKAVVESVLSSENTNTEEMLVSEIWSGNEYKEMKELFDKVAGVELSEMELTKHYNSSGSGTSSYSNNNNSSDWDDLDAELDKIDKALEELEDIESDNAYKAAKAASKALKALDDLDDWDD